MLNTLLFVHLVIALLLVAVILLQKTGVDGLSGIGGGNNMGIMTGRAAASFLTRTTVILAGAFFINALILANLSSKKHTDITTKLQNIEQKQSESQGMQETQEEEAALPIAK